MYTVLIPFLLLTAILLLVFTKPAHGKPAYLLTVLAPLWAISVYIVYPSMLHVSIISVSYVLIGLLSYASVIEGMTGPSQRTRQAVQRLATQTRSAR